eukprot:scaffold2191_cov254-Pinguiococcus_pyrenoidosus.AAC.31
MRTTSSDSGIFTTTSCYAPQTLGQKPVAAFGIQATEGHTAPHAGARALEEAGRPRTLVGSCAPRRRSGHFALAGARACVGRSSVAERRLRQITAPPLPRPRHCSR